MNISVAIPETSLSDESQKSAKTRKASVIARACAIFGVEAIYVYGEGGSRDAKSARSVGGKSDADLLITSLRYLETPQFLRRHLFAHTGDLKFAGVMLPLRIPSHTTSRKLEAGQVREGVIIPAGGKKGRREVGGSGGGKFIDVGANRPLRYTGRAPPGRRVTVRIKNAGPDATYAEIDRKQAGLYWGYSVRGRASLKSLLAEWEGQVIVTSRKGRPVRGAPAGGGKRDGSTDVPSSRILRDRSDLLVVFGSPERGVHEILGGGAGAMSSARILDFFPGQQTATVRLEEAILGALAIINAEAAWLSSR
ncbi:MAG: hypothetical protein OXP12_03865 [Thaumarchaeota archaeon]|nr:hypothetical protein [Nitrososphaerota archaeon]MDE0265944.1 hypothetical protein [Nitrososphaerota archaeon]MDE0525719.1 hypothetical protein [Nitrososphaerota archaeon]